MSLYQRLVRNVLYPLDRWRSGDAAELHYLREFERTQFLPAGALQTLQLGRLRSLLVHAYQQCIFYRGRFAQAGLHPDDVRSLADLAALPILEKRDIQENRDRLVASDWPKYDLIANQTGGSTGSPLSFYLSRDRFRSRAAATIRHNRWAGWDVGDKAALLWGAPRDLPSQRWRNRVRNLLIDRCLFLDTGHMTEAKLAAFHVALLRFAPRVMLAYAGAIVLFARYLQAHRLVPHQPQAIITSAEVLEPNDRDLVEQVFGCRVFNRYGCREVSVIASECAEHRGMHTMAEGLYIEIVKGDRPARPGELGSILVTDLLNRTMPLIRYRIGDLGAWETGSCPCGRSLPRLRSIAGRVTDFLVGADERLVSGAFLTASVVAHRPSLGQVQIHQDRAGHVRYRIRPGRAFHAPQDLDYLRTETRRYLGAETGIDFEFVEEIQAEPSGKFIFSRSTVAVDYLSPRASTRGLATSEDRS